MRSEARGLVSAATSRVSRRVEHRRVARLLPWWVNDTLPRDERRLVERHLGGCRKCRRRAAEERRLATLVAARPLPSVAPHPANLEALLRRVDEPPPRRPTRRWLPTAALRAPRAIWLVLGAQALALVLAAAALLVDRGRERAAPAYRTLTAPAPEIPAGELRFWVVFAPSAAEEEIRALLESLGGRLVDGPTALGVYTLALQQDGGEERIEAVLERLRGRPEVLFVEPALGSR